MWLSKIKLHNFKSYESAEFNFDPPQVRRNIVLIGAQNGHGKTTLLEALYLCLYGEEATPHLKRAGIPDKKSYGELLKDAMYQGAMRGYYGYQMSVEVTILSQDNTGQQTGIRIQRRWHYDNDQNYQNNDDECLMWRVEGEQEFAIDSDEHKTHLKQYALPFDYAPFFLYDGEKIVKHATDAGAGIWLKKGLEGLSGMTLLSDLSDDLKKYVDDRLRNVGADSQADLQKKEREHFEENKRAEKLAAEKAELEQKRQELENAEDQLQDLLGGGSDSKSTEELRTFINDAKNSIKQLEEQISNALKHLPSAILPAPMIDALSKKLRAEEILLSHNLSKERGEGKIEEFQEAFANNPSALEVVGKKTLQSEELRQAIREAWNTLWFPLPKGSADTIQHNYLTIETHQNIQDIIRRMSMPDVSLDAVCKDIADKETNIEQWQRKLNEWSGSNRDDVLKKLKQTSDELKSISVSLKGKTDAHTQSTVRLGFKENELEELKRKIIDAQPDQIKSHRANQTRDVIDNIRKKLIQLTLDELSSTATNIHKQLAHDERIARIEILSTGGFKVYAQDGSDITVGLSSGQTQILIMSLVPALAKVTHYLAPFVIDTPLGRLDKDHRQRLFNHWAGLSQQVILLSTDTEITSDVLSQLRNHVQKTYLVTAQTLASGGARSEICENQYFAV